MTRGERSEHDDNLVEVLGEAVDEAMSPVTDEMWAPLHGPVLEALQREEAARYRPTVAEIMDRMRRNGLADPEPPDP